MADPENIEARIKMLEHGIKMLDGRANAQDVHSEHVARQIADLVLTMQAMHRDLRNQLQEAAEKRAASHQELVDHIAAEDGIKVIAFVDGDAHKHRRQHELQEQRDIEAGKDWRDIRLHVVKAGAVGVLLVVLGLLGLGALSALSSRLAELRASTQ